VNNPRSTIPVALTDRSKKLLKQPAVVATPAARPVEIGGPKGPEPTRFGDWEKAGRCSDF
jgi:hypothetical protein